MTLQTAILQGTKLLEDEAIAAPRLTAEVLLMHALQKERSYLYAHSDEELGEIAWIHYGRYLHERMKGKPTQYITGRQEFYGLRFRVTPDVLIPRPETEHLVEALLARVPHYAALRVADVGTGSGAIAVALAHVLPQAQVTALDISPAALAVARRNAEDHGVEARMRFVASDLLSAVRGERFDAVVSNPPYIAESEVLEAQVRDYEPHTALFAGATGLEVYARLIPQAREA